MPRGIPNSKFQDATEVGQSSGVDIPTTGSIADVARPDLVNEIEVATTIDSYTAELAFMEEPVDVIVHESTDKNAEMIVDVYCNGVPQRFIRGQVQTVKRKFVEILANARQTSISTRTVNTDSDVINRIDKHTALRYPFSVAYDPSGQKGAAWLKRTLSAA